MILRTEEIQVIRNLDLPDEAQSRRGVFFLGEEERRRANQNAILAGSDDLEAARLTLPLTTAKRLPPGLNTRIPGRERAYACFPRELAILHPVHPIRWDQ